jgi:lipopolysaccharide transport system permease protein
MSTVSADYEVVIERSRGWLQLNWRELWEYRDLLRVLIERDFSARYRQTLLGPLWFVLQPVLTTIVFAIVFGRVAGIPTDGIPGPLFYLCGLLGWTYFAQTITAGGSTFISNAHLFSKVYFPRVVVPLAGAISNLFATALQLLPLVAFYVYYKFFTPQSGALQIGWHALLLPLPILHIVILALGVSLWMAAGAAKYRDLSHLNQFLVQLWMFATPIIYPLSTISPQWQWLFRLNPMSVPIEALRICLLGRGTLGFSEILFSAAVALLLFGTGLVLFQRVERTVTDLA